MLRVGLTGGIGAGKSTVARQLRDLGAVLIDADVIAREVLEPGSSGLAAVVGRFGSEVLTDNGTLDRPALAGVVFGDPAARTALNAIVHPLVAARRAELAAAAPADAVVVEDIPLLIETQMASGFPLVLVVHADAGERRRRLMTERGMSAADVQARLDSQATDEERRAAADVWLENPRRTDRDADPVPELVETLWHDRLVPFAASLRHRRRAGRDPQAVLVPHRSDWAAQARRSINRIQQVAGDRAVTVEHIGSTAVEGLDAKDVLDIQVVVSDLPTAADLADDLLAVGLVRLQGRWFDRLPGSQATVDKVFAANADPHRAVNVHIRDVASPVWRQVLSFRDWLRKDPSERAAYAELKHRLAAAPHADCFCCSSSERRAASSPTGEVCGKSDFVDGVLRRAEGCVGGSS